MPFFNEPTSYNKTILSDLQGTWDILRNAVVDAAEFKSRNRMLFHIDEAMSWETVRHLETMKPLVTLIRNIAIQGEASEEILQAIEDVSEVLDEVMKSQDMGKLP